MERSNINLLKRIMKRAFQMLIIGSNFKWSEGSDD